MRIGIVGLGIMGQAMAARLLASGETVFVTNRTPDKAEDLLSQGAQWRPAPGAVAAECDVVISLVTDPHAVADVSLGADGILAHLPPDSIHADMSTVTPMSAKDLAEQYRQQGKHFVQAPVLGSKRQIESGTLLIFGGGSAADVAGCEAVWKTFAARVWRFDTPEAAATAKLACNQLIAHMIVGLGQSLILAQAGGVPPDILLDILSVSAMNCEMFQSKGAKLLTRDFSANFVVRNMLKDLNLVVETAKQLGIPQPLNGLTREHFIIAERQGWGSEDYSAVVKVLELLAGQELARPE